jgi:hypothetical protein
MPNIEQILNRLYGSKFFTLLDCISGYFQIQLTERDKQLSAFICYKGLFAFKVMPFRICNAGATFKRIMEMILHYLTNSTAYSDNIFTHSRNVHLFSKG